MRKFENTFGSTTTIEDLEIDLFKELESRLKLRALLSRKKAENFGKSSILIDKEELSHQIKMKEKNKILEKLKNQKK